MIRVFTAYCFRFQVSLSDGRCSLAPYFPLLATFAIYSCDFTLAPDSGLVPRRERVSPAFYSILTLNV